MTRTNYQLLNELLNDFNPEQEGILSLKEQTQVIQVLQLSDASEIELRNMRDFVVIYMGNQFESHKDNYEVGRKIMDKMSGITYVIDGVLFARGCEV